jgi:glycosyltransferase involved in cell wall biosynthesis
VTIELLYFVSHPIQYQAPLLRQISADPDINLTVIFENDFSSNGYFDEGFGVEVEWDIPLRDGYHSVLLGDVDPANFIKEADAVWFHGWQSRQFRRLMRQAKNIGTPILLRGENWAGAMPDGWGPKGWLKCLYLSHIFSNCSAFLAVGSVNRAYYMAHSISESKIFHMPYAVDNSFFNIRATAEAGLKFRRELGVGEDQKIVLFAGKFSTRKKPDILLEAWERADWSASNRPALVYVGDGELKQSLMSVAERSKYKDDIYFTGFRNQTELPGVYRAADVFVLASEKEPWGLGINEAMASGTAVIASDQCGAAFDLISEEIGALVPAGDIAELCSALAVVLKQSNDMGHAAIQRVADWGFEADISGLKQALDFVR